MATIAKRSRTSKLSDKREDDNVLLVSGAVPGSKGGYVIIRPAVKHPAPDQKLKAGGAPVERWWWQRCGRVNFRGRLSWREKH